MELPELEGFEQDAIDRAAGLVFIPRGDYVIVWTTMASMAHRSGYDPIRFSSDLMASNPRAMAIARKIVEQGRELFGAVELGKHIAGKEFHRLELGSLVGVRGTILTKEIRIS